MMRSKIDLTDEQPLDPAIAGELALLDAALRGEACADEQLAALVREVRAQAPVMPPELRGTLRDEVAAGFPRRRGRRAHVSGAGAGPRAAAGSGRGKLLFGGGIGAILAMGAFAVVFVAIGTRGEDASEISRIVDASGAAPTPLSQERTESSSASSAGALTEQQQALVDRTLKAQPSAGTQPRSLTPATGPRRVERAVDLVVRVKSGKLDEAAGQVGGIVRQAGGYVSRSSVSLRTRGAGTATYTLKVSSDRLDRAVDGLAALGTVTRQEQEAQDITSSFDSAQGRLDDANALRAALLRALAKADTAGEIASLRARIADNRRARASLDAQLGRLRQRTNLSTVALTLRAPTGEAASAAEDDGRWSIGDAAGDALRTLGTVAGGLLVAAGAVLPFAIIAAIAWPLLRIRHRRRREAALD